MGSAFTEKREKNEKEESVLSMKSLAAGRVVCRLEKRVGSDPVLFLESFDFLLLVLTIQVKS